MSYEVGIDLVEFIDIKDKMNDRFIHRVLSEKELNFYQNIQDESRKTTFLSGRFAAKEAIFKALIKGDKTANFRDFTILNDEHGAPYLLPHPIVNGNIKLSISHTKHYCVAIAIYEKVE